MQDPADGVVEQLGLREGVVSALMGENPYASAEQALEDCVQAPENEPYRIGWNVLGSDKGVEEIEGGGQADNVAEDVSHAEKAIALEAVLGNGITELLDREVWDLEFIAVGVDQLAVRGLLLCSIEGGHGGEGCRGRRAPRGLERRSSGGRGRGVGGDRGCRGDGAPQGWVSLGGDSRGRHFRRESC